MYAQDHPGLKPFLESGLLELAIFDAVHDKVIHLAHSNKVHGQLMSSFVSYRHGHAFLFHLSRAFNLTSSFALALAR